MNPAHGVAVQGDSETGCTDSETGCMTRTLLMVWQYRVSETGCINTAHGVAVQGTVRQAA